MQDSDGELDVRPTKIPSTKSASKSSAPAPKQKTFKLNVPLSAAIPGYKGSAAQKKRKKEGGRRKGPVSKKEKGKRKGAAKRGGQS